MLTKENNELVTHTGPGTPGGDLMRCYWQPVALSRELKNDPLSINLLGEELVMFRDGEGKPKLLYRYCPHRAVDLSYGRVEDSGIRCIYHGWLIDGSGKVVDRPCEPDHLRHRGRIHTPAYPCHEAGGLILAYLGKGEPPKLPAFHFLNAPASHTFVMKLYQECNYLQGNEGNIDPAHLSFLHTFLDEGVQGGMSLRTGFLNDLISKQRAPELHVAETPYGVRINSARDFKEGTRWVRITNFIMPNCSALQGSPPTDPRTNPIAQNSHYQLNWHVPIDDNTHWKYIVTHRYDGPVDPEFLVDAYEGGISADFVMDRRRANRFKQNREEMRTRSFAGLGTSFFVHDKCVIETQGSGPIMDRSKENLGTSDRPIVTMRKQLLEAINAVKEGKDPRMVDRAEGNSLADLSVLSAEVPANTDLNSDWWRSYYESGKPKPGL